MCWFLFYSNEILFARKSNFNTLIITIPTLTNTIKNVSIVWRSVFSTGSGDINDSKARSAFVLIFQRVNNSSFGKYLHHYVIESCVNSVLGFFKRLVLKSMNLVICKIITANILLCNISGHPPNSSSRYRHLKCNLTNVPQYNDFLTSFW